MKLYPYNEGSGSAKDLAAALGIKRIRHEGKPLRLKVPVINWGASQFMPNRGSLINDGFKLINTEEAIIKASNKLTTFKELSPIVEMPKWTESREEASEWFKKKGMIVVCRTKLNGHSGEGIVLANNVEELVAAPLYVQYVPKKEEFRIHVMHNEVFFVQKKMRKVEVPDEQINWKIRNHQNGFIYANQAIVVDELAKMEAVKAVAALGLDFGAVDVIFNEHQGVHYILEVNTAPGLAGTTLDKYVEQFKRYM